MVMDDAHDSDHHTQELFYPPVPQDTINGMFTYENPLHHHTMEMVFPLAAVPAVKASAVQNTTFKNVINPTTITGYIRDTHDALLVLEACLTGQLNDRIVRKRLSKPERLLIKSGSIFVFYERQAQDPDGIQRWTDGMNWSPSRIDHNFLLYSELESKMDRHGGIKRSSGSPEKDPQPRKQSRDIHSKVLSKGAFVISRSGLQKKSISVSVPKEGSALGESIKLHLLCYYKHEDVERKEFIPITEQLKDIKISDILLHKQDFRKPIYEVKESVETNIIVPSAIASTTISPQAAAPAKRKKASEASSSLQHSKHPKGSKRSRENKAAYGENDDEDDDDDDDNGDHEDDDGMDNDDVDGGDSDDEEEYSPSLRNLNDAQLWGKTMNEAKMLLRFKKQK